MADRVEDALAAHRLIALATTASTPHLAVESCRPGTLLLHLSLRDLTPETILAYVNIVDDADHVCREATSLHLTEQQVGNRDFITASLGEVLADDGYRRDETALTIFSPSAWASSTSPSPTSSAAPPTTSASARASRTSSPANRSGWGTQGGARLCLSTACAKRKARRVSSLLPQFPTPPS